MCCHQYYWQWSRNDPVQALKSDINVSVAPFPLSPLYPLCPFLSDCLSISLSLPLHPLPLQPIRLEYKAVVGHEALPSSPVCDLAQYKPPFTPLPPPRPCLSGDSGPAGEGYHVIKSSVLFDTQALTQVPSSLALTKKEKDREVRDSDSGATVRKKTDKRGEE